MNITIKETGAKEKLSIIDTKTGIDYTLDFVGNQGALIDGQFAWDDETNTYVCSKEDYEWWDQMIADYQSLENRLYELRQQYDADTIADIVQACGSVDFEDYPAICNAELNKFENMQGK